MAGRVSYLDRNGVIAHGLVDFEQPVAVIPSLAIHLDRTANESRSVNAQTYLPARAGPAGRGLRPQDPALRQRLEGDVGAEVGQVLDHELLLYDTQRPAFVGLTQEFIASARLDNLLSCFRGLRALLDSGGDAGALLVCNDHEEVGSTTAAGARGPMLTQMPGTPAAGAGGPQPGPVPLHADIRGQRPRRPSQLHRPARRQPRSAAERWTRHQDQRQSALCHQQRDRRGLSDGWPPMWESRSRPSWCAVTWPAAAPSAPWPRPRRAFGPWTWAFPSGRCTPSGSWRARPTRSTWAASCGASSTRPSFDSRRGDSVEHCAWQRRRPHRDTSDMSLCPLSSQRLKKITLVREWAAAAGIPVLCRAVSLPGPRAV